MHRGFFLIADAYGFNALKLDAEERPAADYIVLSLLCKRLETGCDFRKILNLIEEDQCLRLYKLEVRLYK